MAVRLATIRAVGISFTDPLVTIADMEWGRDVALWSATRMAEDAGDYVSDDASGRLRAKIVRRLKEAPSHRMKERDLYRALNTKSKDVREAIGDLALMGRVERETITRGSTTSATVRLLADEKPARRRRVN